MELLLPESVPDLDLDPLVAALDIERGHGEDLADARALLVLRELVEDTPVGQRRLAHSTVADQDELVVMLARHNCHISGVVGGHGRDR